MALIALTLNGKEYKIDPDPELFTAAELNGIERNTGMLWREWFEQLGNSCVSSLAWTALAWVAVRRAGEYVPWDEFEDSLKPMELIGSASPEEVPQPPRAVRRAAKRDS